jgi:hypothetical protein
MIKKFGYILFCGILFYLLYACKEKSRSIEYEKNELLTLDVGWCKEKEGFNRYPFFLLMIIVKFNESCLSWANHTIPLDKSHDTQYPGHLAQWLLV